MSLVPSTSLTPCMKLWQAFETNRRAETSSPSANAGCYRPDSDERVRSTAKQGWVPRDLRAEQVKRGGTLQKIFRCKNCQRGMRVVGSTGLQKETASTRTA